MKKIVLLLLCFAMVFALCACGTGAQSQPEPVATAEPEVPEEKVFFLSYDTENDAIWQELASAYTTQTGIQVRVKTLDSNEYGSELAKLMESNEPPTLFMCSPASIDAWRQYSLDLSESEVYKQLRSQSYALVTAEGAVCAAAIDMDAFGIVANLTLLQSSEHSLAEIRDFNSLKAVCDDIHARSEALGFDAFAPAALSGDSADKYAADLVNAALYYELNGSGYAGSPPVISGGYLDNYKRIFDLMITDSSILSSELQKLTTQQSEEEFVTGRAAFIMGNTELLSTLTDNGMDPAALAMLPLYCGVPGEENAGLCAGSESYWAVNNTCDEEDIQATLDFMSWTVTSSEGLNALDEAYGLCPYKQALPPDNVLAQQAVAADIDGRYPVIWYSALIPNRTQWTADVGTALRAYTAKLTDADWKNVTSAMVDGWAAQYAAAGN